MMAAMFALDNKSLYGYTPLGGNACNRNDFGLPRNALYIEFLSELIAVFGPCTTYFDAKLNFQQQQQQFIHVLYITQNAKI